jgi:hypothetical protein
LSEIDRRCLRGGLSGAYGKVRNLYLPLLRPCRPLPPRLLRHSLRFLRLHIGWRLFPRSHRLSNRFPLRSSRSRSKRLCSWDAILFPIRPSIQIVLSEMPHRKLLEAGTTFQTRHRMSGDALAPIHSLWSRCGTCSRRCLKCVDVVFSTSVSGTMTLNAIE